MGNVGLGWIGTMNGLMTQPVLAQVNFGGNPAAFLGVALVVGGASLYFLRTLRPQLARDHDIAFAAIALLCGAILFFQGWRLDPILAFGQYLLAGSAGWFAFETIRLRGATTEQAKRSTPVVDNERPVSRVYRAELDDLTPLDEQRPISRRIRGTRDTRASQADDYGDEGSRRRPSSPNRSLGDRSSSSSGSRRRRPSSSSSSRPVDPPAERSYWDDDADNNSYGGESYGSSYSSRSSAGRSSSSSSKPRRPRPSQSPRRSGESSSDYVDYQPVDYSDDVDNSSNFD